MSIPNFQEVMLPVLETVADGNEHKLADLKDRMSDKFNLTEDERQQLLPGGKKVMASRVVSGIGCSVKEFARGSAETRRCLSRGGEA